MHISPALQFRLALARGACIDRMQDTADWLLAADPSDLHALRQCSHRLVGTLGSYGFDHAARLARDLDRSCEGGLEQVKEAIAALVAGLRGLPR
ncbi:Hpt domain-containing protein [Sphingomonas glaciei]|uniref:Hpt domain-containing protein n=1 Tax=Sphingomonas glaciei TaxID=2938948 RepID=A0ABY5MVE6_9SPHN|nr:Hpt domain-containing protein [Sphingomonas glaciei]UUR08454.1 Hpt domain-containing protein [Sphingomonas glaciei]